MATTTRSMADGPLTRARARARGTKLRKPITTTRRKRTTKRKQARRAASATTRPKRETPSALVALHESAFTKMKVLVEKAPPGDAGIALREMVRRAEDATDFSYMLMNLDAAARFAVEEKHASDEEEEFVRVAVEFFHQ